MRFIIACGGTGGHFYPGYTLGRRLCSRGHEVLFILRREDPAGSRLDFESLPYAELDMLGMPRGLSTRWPVFFWKLAGALRSAGRILRSYQPQAAVGMGGYLTFPIVAAARLQGVPYVLHESNALVGLANKVCAGGAYALALGLPLKSAGGGLRTVLTGTPIREELLAAGAPGASRQSLRLAADAPTLLVFGGSQGAQSINETVPAALALLAAKRSGPLQVIHLTGYRDEQKVIARYQAGPKSLNWAVLPYADDMAPLYAAADLVLSRAGASTLSELIALRKPSLLVPYPHAAAGHQRVNARLLEEAGAARVIEERRLSARELAGELERALDTDGRLAQMAAAYDGLSIPAGAAGGAALADLVEAAAGAAQPAR